MDLTIQILTINNDKTIEKTINSILPLDAQIQLIDMGSSDNTLDICKSLHIKTIHTTETNRSIARNLFLEKIKTKYIMYINPWEALVQGHDIIKSYKDSSLRVRIFQENILNKEVRFWNKDLKYKFINPVFEYVKNAKGSLENVIFYSSPDDDFDYKLELVDKWLKEEPLSSQPFYYKAFLMLTRKRYDEFLSFIDQYLFLNPTIEMSTIMSRYYFSMVQIYHKKKMNIALKNLAICLAVNPCMAEFWCLAADGYFFLMKEIRHAETLYENAINLGSKRRLNDEWPMDITKYEEYPKKFLESCRKIKEKILIK